MHRQQPLCLAGSVPTGDQKIEYPLGSFDVHTVGLTLGPGKVTTSVPEPLGWDPESGRAALAPSHVHSGPLDTHGRSVLHGSGFISNPFSPNFPLSGGERHPRPGVANSAPAAGREGRGGTRPRRAGEKAQEAPPRGEAKCLARGPA